MGTKKKKKGKRNSCVREDVGGGAFNRHITKSGSNGEETIVDSSKKDHKGKKKKSAREASVQHTQRKFPPKTREKKEREEGKGGKVFSPVLHGELQIPDSEGERCEVPGKKKEYGIWKRRGEFHLTFLV